MSEEEGVGPRDVLTYQTQYESQKMTFYLDSPPGSPPRLSSEDPQGSPPSSVSPGDSAAQVRSESHGKLAPKSEKGSSDPSPLLRKRVTTSLPSVVRPPDTEGPDDDGEIKYIDEDVEEVSDNEILVKVTFKDSDMTSSVTDMEDSVHSKSLSSSMLEGSQMAALSKEDIMSKFEEQERSFREFLTPSVLELSARREEEMQESGIVDLPHSPATVIPGIDRLQQLVKLMEQVSYLRQQNKKLYRKCTFLEDTRDLLQMQNNILTSKEQSRGRTMFSQRVMQYFDSSTSHFSHLTNRNISSGKPRWERIPSAESDISRSSPTRDKPGTGKLQRSQSDGSLELVDMDFTSTPVTQRRSHKPTREYFLTRADFHKKSRKLQQKWERVKKVFSGKPEFVAKTETSAVSAEQLVRANTKKVQDKQRPPNLQNLPMHGELLSPEQLLMDASPNLQDLPLTPNSIHSEPSTVHGLDDDSLTFRDDADTAPIPKRSRSAGSIVSENSSGNRHFLFEDPGDHETNIEKILYLRMEGRLDRRRSSPTISVHEHDREFMTSSQGLPRSSSVKVMKSGSDLDPDVRGGTMKAAKSDTANKAKAAWDKVKDIIHTRRDSLKKGKPRGTISHAMSDGEISPDFVRTRGTTFSMDDEPLVIRGDTTKTPRSASPSRGPPLRVRTMKVGRNSGGHSPSRTPKRKSLAHVMLNNSPTDVAAFMGITDDFSKRMQEWEEKKKRGGLVKANSFSYEVDPHKAFDQSGATKFSEDFIKKMEEWEQMKGLTSPPKSPDPEKAREVIHPESTSPAEVQQQTTPVLHNLSESFSKTVQEWERVKERRAQGGTSPGPESRSRQRTMERSKSRERDRSRHKYDKEIQKIERKEWKIEREKQKLERMKMKLDMAMESSSGSEGFGDGMAYEYVLKQLQDRDVNRAAVAQQMETRVFSSQHQESTVQSEESFHTRSVSTKDFSESSIFQQRERVLSDSCIKPIPYKPIPLDQRIGPGEPPPVAEPSLGLAIVAQSPIVTRGKSKEKDEKPQPKTSSSTKSSSNIRQELEDKDDQIKDLQYDIQQLTDRISLMDREHHHKIENYKRQLRVANRMGQFSCQTYQMDASLRELRNQVEVLIQAQDILVKDKHALEKKYQASIQENEESKAEFLGQLQDVQERLGHQGPEAAPATSSTTTTVNSLCSLVTRAQAQLNNLKHALSKRDQTIKELERHLLTQRVNNKLLEAGLQRQGLEISYLREQKRKRVIKRSKTFSGHEFSIGQGGKLELKLDSRYDPGKKYMLSKRPTSPQFVTPPDPTSSTDIHSDWLQIIKKQLDEEQVSSKKEGSPTQPTSPEQTSTISQPLPVQTSTISQTSPLLTSTTSQTVMTLCNCPYLTINIPTVAPQGCKLVDSGTQSDHAKLEAASTQTVHTKQAVQAEVVPEKSEATVERKAEPAVVATVTEVSIPDVTATCSVVPKPGILKSGIPKPSLIPSPSPKERITGAKPKATAISLGHVKVEDDDEGDIKRHSYQEWLKREPKPLAMHMRRTASLDVPPDKDQLPQAEAQDSSEVFSSTEDISQKVTDANLLSPDDAAVPQLPHSPVIRSKNLRKLKNTENRTAAITGDARTWKATPPRRFIRHRKNMVERLSMGSMLSDEDSKVLDQQTDTRLRTKSDSSELQAACAIARENSFKRKEEERQKLTKATEHISRMQNLLEVRSFVGRGHRSSSGVRDMISRYEEGKFDRSHLFRKSPSPSVPKVSVMSPRKLKTAAELLQDSIDQKEHLTYHLTVNEKSATIGTPREKLPSTSSDKENTTSPAHPKGPIRQQAVDGGSPLLTYRSQPKPTLLALAYSLHQEQVDRDSTDSQELVKPLKDRTNDRSKGGRTSHGEERTTTEVPETPPRDRAVLAKPRRAPLSALTPPTGKRHKHKVSASSGSPKSEPVTVAGHQSTKPESTMSIKAVEATRHMSKADSMDSSQSAWSSERDDSQPSSAWQLTKDMAQADQEAATQGKLSPDLATERKSRSKAKARFWSKESHDRPRPKSKGPHRFFDKKRTVSPSPARGAISALCMHTMTVSIEDDSTDSLPNLANKPIVPPSPGSDPGDKRSRRGRFLDSNWFQKPKGFFKVSKC